MSKLPTTDAQLWSAIQADDAGALRQLFDRYWLRLYKTAYKYTLDEEVSKEIVHDIFLNIWNRRNALQIESFPHFLLTAIRYQYYNRKRLATAPVTLIDDYSKLDHISAVNEGEQKRNESDLMAQLKSHLGALPKRCQEIFLLSRKEHLSNDEIANLLHISKRTVENQITHALKYLRSAMKDDVTLYIVVCLTEFQLHGLLH